MTSSYNVSTFNQVDFYTFAITKTAGEGAQLLPPAFCRFLAIHRPVLYWMENAYGTQTNAIPNETQCLLFELQNGRFQVWLPLCNGDLRATLRGLDSFIVLDYSGALNPPGDTTLLAIAEGATPYEAITQVINEAQKVLGSFRLRSQKPTPDFMDYFGWCTWDAFYKNVDAEKILDGLNSFKSGKLQPSMIILDDGYQEYDSKEHLLSFSANPKKFPGGLKKLIKTTKKQFKIKRFGIWHAFQGYWTGIDRASFPEYTVFTNYGCIHPWLGAEDKPSELTLVEPMEAERFFTDYHSSLKTSGVDLVKVDNQASFAIALNNIKPWVSSTQKYHYALQNSVRKHFNGNLINCMCHTTDLLFNFIDTNVLRNSDDYQPKFALAGQQHHVAVNAMNAFFNSFFGWPDWDMFQSHNTGASLHAPARAISGGAVYVCDQPYQQDFKLIRRLCDNDAMTLRADRPGLASCDSLLADCEKNPVLLKVSNRIGKSYIIAAFNVCQTNQGKPISSWVALDSDVSDFEAPASTCFAAVKFGSHRVKLVQRNSKIMVKVAPLTPDYWRFSPIKHGIAALGDLSKYNSMAALTKLKHGKSQLTAEVRNGCTASFYCENVPSVECSCDARLDYQNKVLTIKATKPGKFHVKLTF